MPVLDTPAYLDKLNPEQRQAVEHAGGPLLVIAGAGSGKTNTLAHRVAHADARAIDLLEAAHRTRPDEFQALAIAVGAAFGAGQPERARQLAQQALDVALHQIKLSPVNVRAYYFAAIMQLHLGQPEAGRRSIETALAMRPDDTSARFSSLQSTS